MRTAPCIADTMTAEIVEAAYGLGNENDDANLVLDNDVVKILTAKEIVSSMLLLAPWEVLVEIGEYAANFAAVADELNNDPYRGKYTLAGTAL
ncbi:hypothetical protein [Rhodococcus globerulus]|uniref:hypothetical protein n=1 Tax=Rhodococcus globerulus TaxID=33008 RepID=UPI003016B691